MLVELRLNICPATPRRTGTTREGEWTMRSPTSFSIVAGVFVLCVSPVYAQYTTASLGGRVVDSNNAVLPQSQVVVRNVDTGLTQSITTDPSGAFLFPRLPVASYELRVELPGF